MLEVTSQNMSKVSKLLKQNTKSELLALLTKSSWNKWISRRKIWWSIFDDTKV